MAGITLPNAFVDGTPALAADFKRNLYSPSNPASSFAERNGLLDQDNYAKKLGHRCFRLGSGALGGTIKSGRPWDYYETTERRIPRRQTYTPVPGVGIRLWVPWKASLALSWSMVFRSDFEYCDPQYDRPMFKFKLFVNDVQSGVQQHVHQAYDGHIFPNASVNLSQRTWTGTWQHADGESLPAGQWCTAGIRMICEHPVQGSVLFSHLLMRVYSSSFTYHILKLD